MSGQYFKHNRMWNRVYRSDAAAKQGNKCCYCSREMTTGHGDSCDRQRTLEHLKTTPQGGIRDDRNNHAAACKRCNMRKSNMPEQEFRDKWEGRWDEMPPLKFKKPCRKCSP